MRFRSEDDNFSLLTSAAPGGRAYLCERGSGCSVCFGCPKVELSRHETQRAGASRPSTQTDTSPCSWGRRQNDLKSWIWCNLSRRWIKLWRSWTETTNVLFYSEDMQTKFKFYLLISHLCPLNTWFPLLSDWNDLSRLRLWNKQFKQFIFIDTYQHFQTQ